VFAGTTSIGNNGKNTIVLFKDKLVAPHHCDIVLEGSKYVLVDQGSPLGTVVNGTKTTRHIPGRVMRSQWQFSLYSTQDSSERGGQYGAYG
jgi:pSer/pThr/pTyr-binding forkhead associated (FHA) protein